MKTEIKEQLESINPSTARLAKKIIADLQSISGFEVLSVQPWKSNLPILMPFVGTRMESEISDHIKGHNILMQDQRMRENYKI
jgi:hypothetical protein